MQGAPVDTDIVGQDECLLEWWDNDEHYKELIKYFPIEYAETFKARAADYK